MEEEYFYIGIDPGLKGACIAIDQNGEIGGSFALEHYADMPCYRKNRTRSVLNDESLMQWFCAFKNIRMIVAEESPPFKMGTVGAYTSGMNNGRLHLVCQRVMSHHGLSNFTNNFKTVNAVTWQKHAISELNLAEKWDKEISVAEAVKKWGDFPLFTKPKRTADGFSDAAWIAEYGKYLFKKDEIN